MNIAVTGGSGFIGSHVVDKLMDAGHNVRVLDGTKPHRTDVDWRPCDITRLTQVEAAVAGCDAIYHLAAMANVNDVAKAPAESVDINIMGTATMLEAARLAGGMHFIFASTVWVYEATPDKEVDESTPLNPQNVSHLYMAEKIGSEMLAHSYGNLYNFPVTVLRYGIPYGPRMREELVMPIFIKKALAGEPLTIAGDGLQYRNFIYVEDIADAHVRVLARKATGTFNLEGPREVAIIELAEKVNASIPGNGGIVRTEARGGDYQGRVVSRQRAKDMLDWEPVTAFEEGFDKTLAWFLAKWAKTPAAV
ncbi:MAG TPA: NAD-dependent epimerase/dehydratase family protein [Tepidiformaceae bacterium]